VGANSSYFDNHPTGIALVDRIAVAEPIQIGSARIADGVPVDELARAGVVVAVRQAQQARLRIRVVPKLAPEACERRITARRTIKAYPVKYPTGCVPSLWPRGMPETGMPGLQ